MRRFLLLLALLNTPCLAAAQSSQFGVRGLGLPGRAQSARAMGAGGAFSFFDPQSSVTPASLVFLPSLTATFTVLGDYRSSTVPAGPGSVRDSRFPQFAVGGPVKGSPIAVGLSYSNYTTRDFSLAFPATITLRGVPVSVIDTIESRGGLNDLRLAAAYRPSTQWAVGVAAHIITGSNRLTVQRTFSDSLYQTAAQRSELSFTGFGVSLGLLGQPIPSVTVSLLARTDGHVTEKEDSLPGEQRIDLPVTLGAAVRWRVATKLQLAGQVLYRNWSTANDDLVASGGVGSVNTIEAAGGLEFTPKPRRPGHLPLRLGFRYARLPFLVAPGAEVNEHGVSVGTGYTFAADRAGIDLALERTWRDQDGQFFERAWIFTFGVTVRP